MAYTPPLPYTLHFRYATPAQFLHGLGEWDEWMNGKKWSECYHHTAPFPHLPHLPYTHFAPLGRLDRWLESLRCYTVVAGEPDVVTQRAVSQRP